MNSNHCGLSCNMSEYIITYSSCQTKYRLIYAPFTNKLDMSISDDLTVTAHIHPCVLHTGIDNKHDSTKRQLRFKSA